MREMIERLAQLPTVDDRGPDKPPHVRLPPHLRDEIVEALREIDAAIESLSPGCRNQLMEIIAWNREVGGTDD